MDTGDGTTRSRPSQISLVAGCNVICLLASWFSYTLYNMAGVSLSATDDLLKAQIQPKLLKHSYVVSKSRFGGFILCSDTLTDM